MRVCCDKMQRRTPHAIAHACDAFAPTGGQCAHCLGIVVAKVRFAIAFGTQWVGVGIAPTLVAFFLHPPALPPMSPTGSWRTPVLLVSTCNPTSDARDRLPTYLQPVSSD